MIDCAFRQLRKVLLATILIVTFVHPPTFEILQNALSQLHLIARFGFVSIRRLLENSSSVSLDVFIKSCLTDLLVFCAPVLRPALPWITKVGTAMVRLSMPFTCYVSSKMIEVGEYIVDLIALDDRQEMMEAWRVAAKEVVGCGTTLDTGGSSGWFW